MDGGDSGAPGAMDGPEANSSGHRAPVFLAFSMVVGIVMAFVAGTYAGGYIASQGTVSKEGLRQAVAEISQRCNRP